MTGLLLLFVVASPAAAQEALVVDGFPDAVVVAPTGGGARPVVVALHGNFDRPEWMCAAIAPAVAGRAWILCPRGVRRDDSPEGDDRYTHRPVRALLREVDAGRAALVAAHPGEVADGPDVWIGFSLGAHRVASIAVRDPDRVRLAILVEGGDDLFEEDAAERYARTGARVAVTCALPGCERRGRTLVERLEAGGSAGSVERIETCHWCIDVMEPEIQRAFDWLIEGDPRF